MSELRNIEALLEVDGVTLRVIDAEVKQTKLQEPDTFNANLALYGLPAGRGIAYWSSVKEPLVRVFGSTGRDGALLFEGEADRVGVDLSGGRVRLSGRDRSRKAMDTKVTKGYRNKTTSGLLREIAQKHGMDADIAEVKDRAGKIHNLDWVKLVDQWSDWTTISHLADLEGLVAFVHKNKLHVKPLDEENGDAFAIFYSPPTPLSSAFSNNIVSLGFDRNLEAGRPTSVNVHSHHTKTGKSLHSKAEIGGSGERRVYEDRVAGIKTKDHGDRIARKRLRERTRHELALHYEGPGDLSMSPLRTAVVTGTRSDFDQLYFVDTVQHDFGRGYRMRLNGHNTSKGRS